MLVADHGGKLEPCLVHRIDLGPSSQDDSKNVKLSQGEVVGKDKHE